MNWTSTTNHNEIVNIKITRDIPELGLSGGDILTIPRGCGVVEFVFYKDEFLLEHEDFVWASALEALGNQAE